MIVRRPFLQTLNNVLLPLLPLLLDITTPPSVLEKACTTACVTALEQYEARIATACTGQTWTAYDEIDGAPLDIIANVMRFNHDLVCLKDAGRWCNVVAVAAAMQADPGRR